MLSTQQKTRNLRHMVSGYVKINTNDYEEEAMKKMKRILLFGLVVSIILLSTSSFAQEAEVRNLSLEKSVNIALKKNLDFKMTEQNTSLREVDYEQAQANNLLQTSIVNLKNAEFAFKQAQNTLEEQRRQLTFQVMNAYFQV
ncbi:MAG: hypothetical protein U9O41_11010, partial [Candidatus Aerophobetes bacterium]|nr:hypothetical protein [Candidatus Aerophobetes bacterium]